MFLFILCPFCGKKCQKFEEGISSCGNCQQLFDSSLFYQLLSAAWVLRKHNLDNVNQLIERCGIELEYANFVFKYVGEDLYNHKEFLDVVKKNMDVLTSLIKKDK